MRSISVWAARSDCLLILRKPLPRVFNLPFPASWPFLEAAPRCSRPCDLTRSFRMSSTTSMTAGPRFINAMQVQLERRFTNGLMFLVSYNLSRMMSNTNSGFSSFANADLNKNNQKAEWTIDNNDQPNMINIATVYELPIGKGKAHLNNHGIVSNVLGTGGSAASSPTQKARRCLVARAVRCMHPAIRWIMAVHRVIGWMLVPGVQQEFSYSNVYKGLAGAERRRLHEPWLWVLGTAPARSRHPPSVEQKRKRLASVRNST